MLSFQNKKVLVVDDSETMRMFIFFQLIKTLPGVQLMDAGNGLDAIEKLRQQDVDLILTDMNMPELDGAGHSDCSPGVQKGHADPCHYVKG
jgi:two-component system chemotaxis response regulator CheY